MIYTFYSYKGGVGRSMAMANVAEWLYQHGKRVLMIDWDLEAPGIEGYFFPEEDLDQIKSKRGLIDMLLEYKSRYIKVSREMLRASQEIETVSRKLLSRITQEEKNWEFVHKTLDVYASFKKDDIKSMIGEMKALGDKPLTINDVARIVQNKISDAALADIFSININDKIKDGKINYEEVEVYLDTYALLDKNEISQIVKDLQKLSEEQSLNNISLIEVLRKYFSPEGLPEEKQIFLNGLTTLNDICIPLHAQTPSETKALWLMSAGQRNAENFTSYSKAVQDFNWTEFYTSFNGEEYFEWFRQQLLQFADVVLIDSRTGVSEMSGIATRHLADVIAIVTAPNPQNLTGMANMLKSFIHKDVIEKRKRALRIVVIPSRVDYNESVLKNQFEARVHRTINEILGSNLSNDFWELAIPYIPYYNYREELAVDVLETPEALEGTGKSKELAKAYQKIASYLLDSTFNIPHLSVEKPIEPYVGVRSFQTQDAPLFFGRSQEVSKMVSIIAQHGFLIISGPPGSGKSSTITAGLIPVLNEKNKSNNFSDKTVLFIQPDIDPFVSLVNAIANEMLSTDEKEFKEKADKLLRFFIAMPEKFSQNIKDAFGGAKEFIVVIDQLEEIFVQCPDESLRNKFLNGVGNWVTAKDTIVVLAVRSDYCNDLLQVESIKPISEPAIFNLGIPSEKELRQIMAEPATRAGIKFQHGLVERILKDVEHVNYKLPLLQTTLKELWINRTDNTLTHTAYDKLGRIEGVLKQSFEGLYKVFSPKELEAARPLLSYLVNIKTGVRQKLKLSDVDKERRQTLQPFIEKGLLIVNADEKTGIETVELAHDILLTSWPQLNEWVHKDGEFIAWRQLLNIKLENWKNANKKDDFLLNNTSVSEAKQWVKLHENDLLENEMDFIKKSVAHSERGRQIKIGYIILLLIPIIIFAIIYYNKQRSSFPPAIQSDSAQAKAYKFTSDYSAAKNPDLDFNMKMLKEYYQLDTNYRNNLSSIKQEIEDNIAYKFFEVVDTFYSSLHTKTFNANTFFNDSVEVFGKHKNILPRDLQARIDGFAKINITNRAIDSTLQFSTYPGGFYVTYKEIGNVLLDTLLEYKSLENDSKLDFTENFRIKGYTYSTVKKENNPVRVSVVPAQVRIDLFICAGNSREGDIAKVILLLKKSGYNVVRKNFKNPTDNLSPYYVNGNEIRYNGGEAQTVNKLKKLLEDGTYLSFKTKMVRTPTPNSISMFICEPNMPIRLR